MAEKSPEVVIIADLGNGLSLAEVPLSMLREQDMNARMLPQDKFDQLVANIKKRGGLESLPLCVETERGIEIVSGHNRTRAANKAGLKKLHVLLDRSGLNRSQIAAKQLAHNAIEGVDDADTLRRIAAIITDVDDMLESALDKTVFEEPEAEIQRLMTPEIEFEWKTVQFTFLPHQEADLAKLVEKTQNVDYEGVLQRDLFEPFVDALTKTQRFGSVKAIGTAVHAMTVAALKELGENGYDDELEYVPLSSIVGGGAIPSEAAIIIKAALAQMEKNGDITKAERWKALEMWAADYLAGA